MHEALTEQGKLELVHAQADETRAKRRALVDLYGIGDDGLDTLVDCGCGESESISAQTITGKIPQGRLSSFIS